MGRFRAGAYAAPLDEWPNSTCDCLEDDVSGDRTEVAVVCLVCQSPCNLASCVAENRKNAADWNEDLVERTAAELWIPVPKTRSQPPRSEGGTFWTDAGLRQTVERLAAPAHEQEAHLRSTGVYSSLDELALEFDDEYIRIRSDSAQPASELNEALTALDRKLEAISGTPDTVGDFWDASALSGRDWSEIRALASEVLRHLPLDDTAA